MSHGRLRTNVVELDRADERDVSGLKELLSDCPGATVFHTPEWNRLLIHEFGLRLLVFMAWEGSTPVGAYPVWLLPNGLCRSPIVEKQSCYGGPVVRPGYEEWAVKALLRAAERRLPLAHFQLWTGPVSERPTALQDLGYACHEMATPIVSLAGSEEDLFSRLRPVKRTRIRKAIKNGISVQPGDPSLLHRYSEMVAETLGRGGLTPLPVTFYRKVFEELVPLDMARMQAVWYQGDIIAAAITLGYRDTVYYWDVGWDRRYAHMSPSDVLNWEIMRSARQSGYRYYDLLRLEPDRLPGIAAWKSKFGGEVVPCYYAAKATPGRRLVRAAGLLTDPRRAVAKLRQLRTGALRSS